MDTSVNLFIQAARRYCALVEHGGSGNSWVFAGECLASVLDLYKAALLLPQTERNGRAFSAHIEHDLWAQIRLRLQERLSRDMYWEVFEPLVEHEQPHVLYGSLSDDLADIWRDVNEGLMICTSDDDSHVNEAVWHWRFSLESHWGHHACGAINALHALCFGPFADGNRPTGA